MMKVILVPFLALASMALADTVVYCTNNSNKSQTRSGDLEVYEACGDACTCQAYELICLERGDSVFSLVSKSYDDAAACTENQCLCNSDKDAWLTTDALTGGDPLPSA